MKKLLLSLMVLASLVSCGKDNSANSTVATASSSPVTLADTSAANLGNLINSSESTFAAAPAITAYKYKYSVQTIAASGQNCETKEGWFGIEYTVCKAASGNNTGLTYKYVTVGSVDLAAKRSELIGYVNSSYAGGVVKYGTYYQVTTTAGVTYIIDTRAPVQANPVLVRPLSTGEITSYMGLSN